MLCRTLALLTLALAVQKAACQAPDQLPQEQPQGFIRVSNGRFVDDTCSEFTFSGWNGWRLLDYSLTNPAYITSKFQQAQAAKLNVLRFFVAGDDSGPVLMPSPGQLDDKVARGLDFIFAEAAKYNIKLTPVLINFWKENNGVPQFERWCGTSGSNLKPRPDIDVRPEATLNATERLQTPYEWITSPKCQQQVKDYFTALVTRRNSITGTLYKDDATIFSWNLMNEPRCKYCGPEAVDGWFGALADHLKSIDPNHLVTTGEEGFFDERDPMAGINPNDGNIWGPRSGQDFRANHAHASIDYAVIHLWPDNWRNPAYDTTWGQQWIDAHIQVAKDLGKPLVLEEFGKNAGENNITSVRDPWFVMVNGAVDSSLQSGGPLRGALFWQWDGETGPRPGVGSNIRNVDTTFVDHIVPFAHRMATDRRDGVPGCAPPDGDTAAPAGGAGDGPTQSSNAGAVDTKSQPAPGGGSEGGKAPAAGGMVQLFSQDAPPGAGHKLLRVHS